MFKLFKNFSKKDIILIIVAIVLIVGQVNSFGSDWG